MSIFSDLFKYYIHEKNIKVMSLAHYCNLERSTVYKFINGKREPMSMELVEQIARFIQLTPPETYKFKEAWKMARMGENTYYIRKSMERFLSDFPNKSTPASYSAPLQENMSGTPSTTPNCLLLNSRQAVDSSVRRILLSEASKKDGRISLFLQPDYPFLLHLLSTIQPAGTLQIDHIFSLNRTAQFTEAHELYELYYLRNLFPIYMNKLDYRIHCFYTNEISHFKNLSALPYMILTSEYAITCSSDYQMGILYQDSEILQALWNLFRSHQDLCQPVFQTFPIVADDLRPFSSLLQTQGLLPMYQFSFNLKHVFYHFCEEICWKRFLITIFPEQMLLSLWRILYLSIICNGSKMKNLSYTLQNMV